MKSKKLAKIVSLALLGATVMTATPMAANAAWKSDSTGWWYTEGRSWATGWRSIDGVWYYFNSNGYMKTGWVNDNGVWYYLYNSGAMATGWIRDNGIWYFLSPSGAMQTGWIKSNGVWYYLKGSGAMASSEMIDYKGEKYYLENGGAMATGWKSINGDKYYFDGNGASARGQYKIGNDFYYFAANSGKLLINGTENGITTDKDGKITNLSDTNTNTITNTDGKGEWKTVNGKRYFYDEDGKKAVGWMTITDLIGSRHYYFNSEGVLQTGWYEVDGRKYFAEASEGAGYRITGVKNISNKLYLFGSDGALVTKKGLYTESGHLTDTKFYINEDGTVAVGWKTVDGKKYYFNDYGAAVKGITKVAEDGKKYFFDCVTSELVCNADNYGLVTDSNGAMKQVKEGKIKEDILKNDSKELDKLKESYGDVTFEFREASILLDAYMVGGSQGLATIDNESGKEDKDVEKEQVLTYIAVFKKQDGSEVRKPYYVSIKDGTIYTQKYFGVNDNSKKEELYKIKDNEIKETYKVSITIV